MNDNPDPGILAVGTAVPDVTIDQDGAYRLLSGRYDGELSDRHRGLLKKILGHPGIRLRHIAVDSVGDLESMMSEEHDAKMDRFLSWAVRLSASAVTEALASAGLDAADVTDLIVNTCTGYVCPGIATYLVEALALNRDVACYDLVGTGCAGAAPNLQLAENIVRARPDRIAVSVSVEICSATFRMGDEIDLILSNALFGDGAAAAVVAARGYRARLIASESRLLPEHRGKVKFVYRDGYLTNRLSRRLPEIVCRELEQFVPSFLERNDLNSGEVAEWILHPGGSKILDGIEDVLGLAASDTALSRQILRNYGNLSSPSVLFILKEVLKKRKTDGCGNALLATFGAGCAVYLYLLRFEEEGR